MHRISVALFFACVSIGTAKIYTKCGLVRDLRSLSVPESQLADWVCMAEHESSFDTSALGHVNPDSHHSRDHGLFQINDYWNCDPGGGRTTLNGCHTLCSSFRDDSISDDVACIKQLYREHHHTFDFSYAWQTYCQHISGSYLSGC